MDTFDYVIVGAGSAGCVLANRLSEDAGTSLCVLEAGPRDWHPYIHLPAGFIKTFHMRSINWAYQQEPGPWTGGRSIIRAARQDAGRLVLDQRPYLQSWPAPGFRYLGAVGQSRLGLSGCAAVFQAARKPHRRGRGYLSRARGRFDGHHHGLARPTLRSLHGRCDQPRHPSQFRLQRCDPGRRVLRAAHDQGWPARQRGDGVPAPGR